MAVAQAYLAQQGLALHQPRARVANAGAICNACHCPTGLVLEGTVPPADTAAMLALGFTKHIAFASRPCSNFLPDRFPEWWDSRSKNAF